MQTATVWQTSWLYCPAKINKLMTKILPHLNRNLGETTREYLNVPNHLAGWHMVYNCHNKCFPTHNKEFFHLENVCLCSCSDMVISVTFLSKSVWLRLQHRYQILVAQFIKHYRFPTYAPVLGMFLAIACLFYLTHLYSNPCNYKLLWHH